MRGEILTMGVVSAFALAAHASRRSRRQGSGPSASPVVGAVALVFDELGQVLLIRRGPGAPWEPNRWALPGGSIEPRGGSGGMESPAEAAVRETWEEVGLRVLRPIPLGVMDSGQGWSMAYFKVLPGGWRGRPVLKATNGIMEHDAMAWVDPSRLDDYDVVEMVRAMIVQSGSDSGKPDPQGSS